MDIDDYVYDAPVPLEHEMSDDYSEQYDFSYPTYSVGVSLD